MYKKLLTLALLIGAIFMVFAASSDADDEAPPIAANRASPPIPPPSAAAPGENPGTGGPSGPVAGGTAISVGLDDSGGRGPFVFSTTDFTFKRGETVNFSFTSESQFHSFTVNDLGINVDVDGGETVDFSFTFDTPGTYTLICIPHEVLAMVGTITVEDG